MHNFTFGKTRNARDKSGITLDNPPGEVLNIVTGLASLETADLREHVV